MLKTTMRLLLATAVATIANLSPAQWTNGQSATFVIGQSNFTSSAFGTSANRFDFVRAAAIDQANGKLYLADANNHRILRFAWPITANNASAEAVLGQANFTSGQENRGGSATSVTLAGPQDIAVVPGGAIYVVDSGNNRVLRYDNAHTAPNGAGAVQVIGQSTFSATASALTASGLENPTGVTYDSNGRLWIADAGNNRVLRYDNALSLPNGASANGVLGQDNFTTNQQFTTAQNRLRSPSAVAVFGNTLWVCDAGSVRVVKFDNAASLSNGANATGLFGQSNYTSNAGAVTASGFNFPYGMAFDNSGRLYVSEPNNRRTKYYNNISSAANNAPADGVFGQTNLTSDASDLTQTGALGGHDVAVDSAGQRIVVVDQNANRVLVYTATAPLPVSLSGYTIE